MNRGDLADLTAFVAVADQLSFRTPDCWVITTKTLKISSCKNPAARSRSQSPPSYEAKPVSRRLAYG
jgi:hypothetical protein